MNLNLYLLEQPPFQNFDPSNVYLRSYNKDKKIFLEKLDYYSIKSEKYLNNQIFSQSILQKNAERYKNVHFVKINDIFCKNEKNICKIGNETNSFYRDKNHLNKYGAALVKDELLKNIK